MDKSYGISVKGFLLVTLYIFIVFSLIGISSLWQQLARLTNSYNGFAVDSQGNLYVCCHPIGYVPGYIDVYDNTGAPLRRIETTEWGTYHLTITEDDLLLVRLHQYIYVMDPQGNTLEIIEADESQIDSMGELEQQTYIKNQTKYIKRTPWARTCIYRVDAGGETLLYKMPLPDYCARIMHIIGITLFLIPFFLVGLNKVFPNLNISFLDMKKYEKSKKKTGDGSEKTGDGSENVSRGRFS